MHTDKTWARSTFPSVSLITIWHIYCSCHLSLGNIVILLHSSAAFNFMKRNSNTLYIVFPLVSCRHYHLTMYRYSYCAIKSFFKLRTELYRDTKENKKKSYRGSTAIELAVNVFTTYVVEEVLKFFKATLLQ